MLAGSLLHRERAVHVRHGWMDRAEERVRTSWQWVVAVLALGTARDRLLVLQDLTAAVLDVDVVGDRAGILVLEVDDERGVGRCLELELVVGDALRDDVEHGRSRRRGWRRGVGLLDQGREPGIE